MTANRAARRYGALLGSLRNSVNGKVGQRRGAGAALLARAPDTPGRRSSVTYPATAGRHSSRIGAPGTGYGGRGRSWEVPIVKTADGLESADGSVRFQGSWASPTDMHLSMSRQ